jgi:enamine deaminase RidA (YjgF/YER057c/UK114 family)
MKKKIVSPKSVFSGEDYGFSQGVLVGGGKKTLFISGQLAADRKGKFMNQLGFRDQCERAYEGINAVLKDAGAKPKNIVKITAYVTDMANSIGPFTELTKKYFKAGEYPASTLLEVKGLAFPGQLVEIEAVAVI